jgi:hypothetical protein
MKMTEVKTHETIIKREYEKPVLIEISSATTRGKNYAPNEYQGGMFYGPS